MNIIIECINFDTSEALNDFIRDKANALTKVEDRITRMEFTLRVERIDHTKSFSCALVLNVPGKDVVVTRTAPDAHESVSMAIESARRSLNRRKTKRLSSRRQTKESI